MVHTPLSSFACNQHHSTKKQSITESQPGAKTSKTPPSLLRSIKHFQGDDDDDADDRGKGKISIVMPPRPSKPSSQQVLRSGNLI